ncbi:TetR/AcrR family transcriptional regulator [Pseudonocardia humida]|uniref:Helix-turn-helix transcriptional regulator n=1 Tax=Pseudonocardia humida TaxID=2800819 RepID=A0ABT1A7P6_9PSEU|nr:helix-turn-helix domain-containing protein [Pseudonocardia humida]MCO1658859.1 helix-turn-helix transcriptional regulator [Pseudonocardia humida]
MGPTRAIDDQTARARIRDVALALLAEHGVAATSIRGVADAAGVSTGLVQHHFGSKAGLVQACDDFAIGAVLDQARRAAAGDAQQPGFTAQMYPASEASVRYLARALVDGSPAAAELFDSGAELAEKWLSSLCPDRFPAGSGRVRNAAAVMGAMHLGTLVLHTHLSRRAGADVLDREHTTLVSAGIFDVYGAMAEFLATPDAAALRMTPAAEGDRDE